MINFINQPTIRPLALYSMYDGSRQGFSPMSEEIKIKFLGQLMSEEKKLKKKENCQTNLLFSVKIVSFFNPPVHIVWWAHMRQAVCPFVCPSLDINSYLKKFYSQESETFYQFMSICLCLLLTTLYEKFKQMNVMSLF